MSTAPAIEPLAYAGNPEDLKKPARPVTNGQQPQQRPVQRVVQKTAVQSQPRPVVKAQTVQQKVVVKDSDRPWWFLIPKVIYACYKIVMAPFALLVMVAELIMAAVVLGIVAIIAGWWTGWIPEAQIVDTARQVGDRLMAMLQSSGYL